MNLEKVRRAIELLTEALSEVPQASPADWEEYGRATASAVRVGYEVVGISKALALREGWRPEAVRLYYAAKRVGF